MSIEPMDLYAPERRQDAKLLVEGLSKTFGGGSDAVQALAPTDLAVGLGDFLCVVGPSGCGKTTLLNLLAGFEAPSSGRMELDGKPILRPGAERGVVFQQGALFNWLSVLENVAFGPRACGVPAAEARTRAQSMLEMVGLGAFAKKYPYQLSGGMQQRANLCRALIHDPALLMLDEPFGALDAFTREDLWQGMRDLHAEKGFTVILVTHDLREAVFLADRVFVMSARPGRIIVDQEVGFARPRPIDLTYEAEFNDIVHELRGHIAEARAAA